MKVSVIVPNYNHLKFLPKRLETIFNQTFQDFEVILLDDCSTDDSWQFLEGFAKHPKVSHCIRNEENSGSPFKQWQKGIDLSKFELIWIAESDDFCESSFLEVMVSKIRTESSLVYCASIYIDEADSVLEGRFPNWSTKDQENGLRWRNDYSNVGRDEILNFLAFKNTIVNASSVVFRKPLNFPVEILSMRFCGDWYFWIYLLKDRDLDYCSRRLNYFRTRDLVFASSNGDSDTEYIRFREIVKCIKFSRIVLGIGNPRRIDLIRYSDLMRYYAWNFGKLNLPFIFFVEFPYFLIPVFLFYYFKHVSVKFFHSFFDYVYRIGSRSNGLA